MRKIAVIIKHPYRDFDYRVDIVEVSLGATYEEIKNKVLSEMLGPFEVIAMTEKINFDRKIVLS